MTYLNSLKNWLRRGVAHVRENWEAWAATAVAVALTGFELLSDYLPLIAGAVGGWELVALTSAISFSLAALRTRAKRMKRAVAKDAKDAGAAD